MRLNAVQAVASYRASQVAADLLIVVWRLHIPLPEPGDELELDGQLYQLVEQLWPATGVMGAVFRFRRLAASSVAS